MPPSTVRQALALAALVAAACTRVEPPAGPRPETVRALATIVASCASAAGTVQVRRAGQTTWEDVSPGTVFRVGDEVRTTALSSARIEFLLGGGLELDESADVVIDVVPLERPASAAGPAPAEPRIAVRDGVVRGFLPEAATPTATPQAALVLAVGDGRHVRLAAEAGAPARFRLIQKADGTEVAVTAGQASLRGAGALRALRSGQLAVASAAGVTDAVELLEFPQSTQPGIDARFHLVAGLAVRLAWRPVAGASGYHVQIARDLSFQHLVRSARLTETELTFGPKAPGTFAWRVASIDRDGRQGEYGFARRVYCEEKPPVDLLVGPADGAVIRFAEALTEVTFTWAPSGEAQAYRLVLARGPDLLEDRVESTVVSAQRARLRIPEAGDYWWGVYQGGVYQDSETPPQPLFTRPRRIQVVKGARPKMNAPREITRWGD